MCGIAGIVSAEPLSPDTEMIVRRMCASLRHRGPDEQCLVKREHAVLGLRRLAIIDPRPGRLPITNEDDTVFVSLNGEIYNYRSLRRQLHARGHRFRTNTDTEVIAHLYEEYGEGFVDHLEGMFAVSLWDDRQQQLILARDRLGVKPVFYHFASRRIRYGSEIKALLQDPHVQRRPNLSALDCMLTFGFTAAPETFLEDVLELPAASMLCFRRGTCRIRSYWDAAGTIGTRPVKSSNAIAEGTCRIREAIQKRLVSDVPLGAFLSGGIDSSIIVAMMSELMEQPVKTFSIGFDDASFSELPYARMVARHLRTEHHEFIVKPEIDQLLPRLIAHHDGPFYDSSAIPTYHLCRLAREHITVALSGDGGDELFAGYGIFAADQFAEWIRLIPGAFRRAMLPLASRCVPETSGYKNRGRVAREFVRAVETDPLSRYARWASKAKRETREGLYKHERLRRGLATHDGERMRAWYDRAASASRLGRLLYVATRGELAGDMLVKVDRMSMASSLEVRSPFLDHALLEWSQTLPDRWKLNALRGKYLLRRIASRLLPRQIARRPKRGFSVPLDRWLRTSHRDWLRDVLLDDRTRRRGLFDGDTVRRMIADHLHERRSYGRELWTLLTIELWFRMYIDECAVQITENEASAQTAYVSTGETLA